jgi:hypothetical protein
MLEVMRSGEEWQSLVDVTATRLGERGDLLRLSRFNFGFPPYYQAPHHQHTLPEPARGCVMHAMPAARRFKPAAESSLYAGRAAFGVQHSGCL